MHIICADGFLPKLCRSALGRPHVGAPGRALRRPLPRRARRVDGRHGAPVDPLRARPDHLAAPVGRVRLRARLRRPAAARRPRRRPARPQTRTDHRSLGLRRRVGDRRPRQRRHAARHHARPEGHERRVHGARRPLDHHDDVRGGPEPQPRARLLHRHRGERLLARPRVRRPAHRARLALDVPAPGPVRAGDPVPGAARGPARQDHPRRRGVATTSPARSRSPRRCCCSCARWSRRPRSAGAIR